MRLSKAGTACAKNAREYPGKVGTPINWLTEFALARGFITLLLSAAVLVAGAMAVSRMNVELMPEMDFPMVTVITAYPGASPKDVAEQVTKPIEQGVANISGVKRLQSTSVESLSIVIAEFDYGVDTEQAEVDIQSALPGISLPQDAQTPRTARIDLNDLPVVQISLMGEVPLTELRRIASDRLVPELSRLDGVYSVELLGGQLQEVQVVLDPEKAAEKGITFQQVASLLQANSLELPAGSVEVEGWEIPVRTFHRFQTLDEVREMVVGVDRGNPQSQEQSGTVVHTVQSGDTVSELAARYGTSVMAIAQASQLANPNLIVPGQKLIVPKMEMPAGAMPPSVGALPDPSAATGSPIPQSLPLVKLQDIATVQLTPAETGGISRTNGEPSILLMVTKRQDANTVRVADAVLQRLDDLEGELGEGVKTLIVSDESGYVERSLYGLGREGLLGMFIAVLVIFAFLRDLRSTLIAGVSIPLSIAIALLAMEWQQLTLNIMTLAGLAVAVGRVVDDGIVVLENSHRHVQAGRMPAEAARQATAEVAMPVTASTLTTVAVFLPLGFIGGIVGQAFRPFAITVTFALLASLLVAITVVPVLCRLLLTPRVEPEDDGSNLGVEELLPERGLTTSDQPPAQTRNGQTHLNSEPLLLRIYTPALRWVLAHPIITVMLAFVLLAASLSLLPGIPTAFLPSDQEKLLTVQIAPPPGAGRETVSSKVADVEKILANTPGVTLYQASMGDETGGLGSMRAALSGRGGGASILVRLEDDADLEDTAADLRNSFDTIQGEFQISIASEESMGTTKVRLVISGSDQKEVEKAAEEVKRELEKLPSLANLTSDIASETSEIVIQVEPSRATELGLTTAQLAAAIRGMVAGQAAGSLEQPDGNLDIRISVPRSSVDSPETLGDLLFGSPEPEPLSEIAQIRREKRSAQITRIDQSPAVDIAADIIAQGTGAVTEEIRERIESLGLPKGVTVDYGGVMEQLSEGFSSMGAGQLVGVGLVYLVMALFFNSLLDPLVILVSLPLAAIGALPALYFSGRTLSMSGMIGVLMLIGIVVTNAIVLLDFARRPIQEGGDPNRALLEAGRIRMRPILMTALTTILALVPLALGLEGGSIIASELAVVVMGGLFSSTFLTLLVVPAVYRMALRRPT
ncbi:MAG: efflux RND transporter permease subunit [Chloroflexota bacterium]